MASISKTAGMFTLLAAGLAAPAALATTTLQSLECTAPNQRGQDKLSLVRQSDGLYTLTATVSRHEPLEGVYALDPIVLDQDMSCDIQKVGAQKFGRRDFAVNCTGPERSFAYTTPRASRTDIIRASGVFTTAVSTITTEDGKKPKSETLYDLLYKKGDLSHGEFAEQIKVNGRHTTTGERAVFNVDPSRFALQTNTRNCTFK